MRLSFTKKPKLARSEPSTSLLRWDDWAYAGQSTESSSGFTWLGW